MQLFCLFDRKLITIISADILTVLLWNWHEIFLLKKSAGYWSKNRLFNISKKKKKKPKENSWKCCGYHRPFASAIGQNGADLL